MIDLNNIMRYHENNRIEAKKAAGGFPHSLWETYSAFANTIGGLILLGVEESRDKQLTVTGVPDARGYVDVVWRTVRDPAKVSANVLSEEDVAVHPIDGKEVLVISVPRANRRQRPVYIGDSPFTGSYRRDGEGDYHCSADEVRAMLRDRDDAPADLAVLEGRSPQDLSQETLRQFRLLMAMRRPEHPWNFLPDDQFLPAAGVLGRGKDGKSLHPTLAGLLLLGRRNALKEVFPQLKLEYRETDTGFRLTTSQPGSPENLFEFYTLVSRRLTAVSSLLAEGNRDELAAAMREAVLNAILHADYFSRGGLTIQRTDTALQVTNGGLLRVSPDEARAGGAADPRNVVLTRLFSLVKLGSGAGKGLKGIYAVWAQQGWSAPVLSEGFKAGITSLSLPLPQRSFSGEEVTRQQIAEYLTDQVTATAEKLETALGLTARQVRQALDDLLDRALIVEGEEGYRLRA
ncbi:MAG: putative DNA binding domain-containing protein [Clostridiales bacterium]|nr:putative DNA binding domain-containing protein [Clostridiales bacterium]